MRMMKKRKKKAGGAAAVSYLDAFGAHFEPSPSWAEPIRE